MTFDTFDTVFFTAGFLVPGFVWSSVLSMFVPRRTTTTEVRLLEFLALSCINHGIWAWALFLIFSTGFAHNSPVWTAGCLGGIMFVSPIALGLALGLARQKNALARLLERFGFRTIHPVPTAWDWHFGRRNPYWALVTLTNGSRVHGLFGFKSFAGDDPDQRDLYLEATFRRTNSGEWAPVEHTGGVLIKADQIASIEFHKITEVKYEE